MHLFLKSIWSVIRYLTQKKLFLKGFNAEFSYIGVWFTDQNSKLSREWIYLTLIQLLIKE